MQTCFVIQPFKNPYDKRFDSLYKPAIEAAGMEAYRVDRDPATVVLVESIERNIKRAAVCLADISEDNPNVWYELGFAFASGRPVVIVCSDQRDQKGTPFPFDIQHRAIVVYKTEAPQDFDDFQHRLTEKLKAMLEQAETLQEMADQPVVAAVNGLTSSELIVLGVTASSVHQDDSPTSLWGVRSDCERVGLNNLGFNVGVRRLRSKGFVETVEMNDDAYNCYPGLLVTEKGWLWIEENEGKFAFHSGPQKKIIDDTIPF